jgi:NAD(P)-dependent dehydrogenase (short-subunit alcohol dehydrogenase family)
VGQSDGSYAGTRMSRKRKRSAACGNVGCHSGGIVRVTRIFIPLLERSDNPVIVNVSSGMGSLGVTTDPARLESTLIGLAYPASKTAVNMLTSQYAKAFPRMRINAVDPGYTATDLNGHRGSKTVEQGAEIIVNMAAARTYVESRRGLCGRHHVTSAFVLDVGRADLVAFSSAGGH